LRRPTSSDPDCDAHCDADGDADRDTNSHADRDPDCDADRADLPRGVCCLLEKWGLLFESLRGSGAE